MSRLFRKVVTVAVPAALMLLPSGCSSLRQAMGLRATSLEEPESLEDEEITVDTPLDVKSSEPRRFFQNSRLSGGLSDQAREIERDLGIR